MTDRTRTLTDIAVTRTVQTLMQRCFAVTTKTTTKTSFLEGELLA